MSAATIPSGRERCQARSASKDGLRYHFRQPPTPKAEDMAENQPPSKSMDRLAYLLETGISWMETVVAILLAIVVLIAVLFVAFATVKMVAAFPEANSAGLFKVIKAVLDTFIVIELFRITIAYVRHREVIPTVLETALVVAAREIVVIEAGADDPLAAAAVGGTLIAIGITWYLLRRGGACGCDDSHMSL